LVHKKSLHEPKIPRREVKMGTNFIKKQNVRLKIENSHEVFDNKVFMFKKTFEF
jgi:hypothetical protein